MSDILSSAPEKYKNDYITYAKGDFKFIENKIKKVINLFYCFIYFKINITIDFRLNVQSWIVN